MKTEDNYRIRIEEWLEIPEIATVPIKHVNYLVQKRYFEKNWFARIILKDKDIWYTQSCHSNEIDAILAMRNQYYRENPKVTYYKY